MKKIVIAIFFLVLMAVVASSRPVHEPMLFVYKLHGQTRKYQYTFDRGQHGIVVSWGIERNTKWQSGSFTMTEKAVENADSMSFRQPVDGEHVILPCSHTYHVILSRKAFADLKRDGVFTYNGIEYHAKDVEVHDGFRLIHVHDNDEGADMWILDDSDLPVVWRMSGNPLGINWSVNTL